MVLREQNTDVMNAKIIYMGHLCHVHVSDGWPKVCLIGNLFGNKNSLML